MSTPRLVSGIEGPNRAQLVKSLQRPRGSSEDTILTACVHRVSGLLPSTQYQFRVRAFLEETTFWSEWSPPSQVFRTLFFGEPSKIAAPLFSSSSTNSLSIQLDMRARGLDYEVQYRLVGFAL